MHSRHTGHLEFQNKASNTSGQGMPAAEIALQISRPNKFILMFNLHPQTAEATAIHTEAEMQQASDAMREALKGVSAASAAVSDMEVEAALEMVCTVWLSCTVQAPNSTRFLQRCQYTYVKQKRAPVLTIDHVAAGSCTSKH